MIVNTEDLQQNANHWLHPDRAFPGVPAQFWK